MSVGDNNQNKDLLIELTYEVKSLNKELDKMTSELEKYKDSLFDPDEGVYKRISETKENIAEHYKMLKALEQKIQNRHDTYEAKLLKLEATEKILVEVGGENLSILRLALEKFKKSDKIIWIMSTAAISGLVKVIYDVIVGFM